MQVSFSFLPEYWPYFRDGVIYTLMLSFFTVVLAVLPAILLALMRLSKNKVLKFIASAYIDIIRGTPMLVQLSIVYYGFFGAIHLPNYRIFGFIDVSMFVPGIIALAVNSSAYVAEIIRAGILAVDKGQTEAARSLGMTGGQTMLRIILPQAIKNILPAIGNEFVTMIKETSIIQYLGVSDLMYNNGIAISGTYNPLPCYYISGIIYLILNLVAGKGVSIFERRLKRSDR